jgi:hypothetical protein
MNQFRRRVIHHGDTENTEARSADMFLRLSQQLKKTVLSLHVSEMAQGRQMRLHALSVSVVNHSCFVIGSLVIRI